MSALLDHRGNPLAPTPQQSNVVPIVKDGLAGLVNYRTGAGTSIDRSLWDAWMFIPLTPQELIAGYRSNWLIGKIVDIPAEDMVREWRDWQAADDQIEKLEEAEQRFDLVGKVQQGIAYGRLGGGAILKGYGDAEPWNPAREKAELQYLHLFNRWELTLGPEITDLVSPWFGQPAYYEISGAGSQTRIHPSRIVPFKAAPVPRFPGVAWEDYFWGDSVIQRVDRAVKNAVKANDGFARLIDEAKIDVYRLSGFMQNLINDEAGVRRRVEYTDAGKSALRGVYLDKDDEFTQRQLSLTGMPEMIETLLSVVAGAADIPATRLLGRAPQGMNATGESDTLNYNTMIRSKQRLYLSPAINRIDEALIPTALGSRPPEVYYVWAPLSVPTEQQQAEIENKEADTVSKLVNTATIPESAMAKAVQNRLIESGRWPGIEEALAEAEAAGEDLPEDPAELDIVPIGEGGDPASAGGGTNAPARRARAANDSWFFADAKAKPLYVNRPLLNADEVIAWAKEQGFEATLPAKDMHVTVLFSRQAVDPMKMGESWSSESDGGLVVKAGGPRALERFDGGAVVLQFVSWSLSSRHDEMVRAGASHDVDEYQPHITLSYSAPTDLDLDAIKPFAGELRFGPELFEPLDLDWKAKVTEDGGSRTSGPPFVDGKRSRRRGLKGSGKGRGSWNPSAHPRGHGGRFASKGGGSKATIGSTRAFTESVRRGHDKRQHSLGPVSNAGRIKAATGRDVTGFNRAVPAFAVQHALKGHGVAAARGAERALRPRDIARVAHRLEDAHSIVARGSAKHGSGIRLEYRVKMGNRTAVYIERIGGKDRTVRMVTARWER